MMMRTLALSLFLVSILVSTLTAQYNESPWVKEGELQKQIFDMQLSSIDYSSMVVLWDYQIFKETYDPTPLLLEPNQLYLPDEYRIQKIDIPVLFSDVFKTSKSYYLVYLKK